MCSTLPAWRDSVTPVLAILGYDAVGVSRVEALLADGRLPTLAALRARGRWHRFEAPAAWFAASSHYTLFSGLPAAEHGIHYPFQWSAPDQRVRLMHELGPPEPVWSQLADSGCRCLVVDPYESAPPAKVHGLCVSGWQFANRVVQPRWSRPEDALRALERRLGRGPRADEVFGQPTARLLRELTRPLVESPDRAATLVSDLLARERFDLVWVTFSPAHLAGHQFWDTAGVLGPAERHAAAELDRVLADVYVAVDAAAGRVVAALPEDADVIVVSPLGMGPNTSRADLLPGMLSAVLSDGRPSADAGRGSLWRLRAAIPTGWRASVAAALPDKLALELTARLETRGVDWGTTAAFVVPSDTDGYVRLNLRGRERDGVVGPQHADALLAEIAAGLATFVEEDGSPSVQEVVRPSAVLPAAPALDRLPDLVVRWADTPAIATRGTSSPRYGEVARAGVGSGRSGNHNDEAWALVCPGASRLRERPSARLEDVAATAVALLGGDPSVLPGEPLLA